MGIKGLEVAVSDPQEVPADLPPGSTVEEDGTIVVPAPDPETFNPDTPNAPPDQPEVETAQLS